VAAYTFDSGPNAVVVTRSKDLDAVLSLFLYYFLPSDSTPGSFVVDTLKLSSWNGSTSFDPKKVSDAQQKVVDEIGPRKHHLDKVSSIIVTNIGDGPKVLNRRQSFS